MASTRQIRHRGPAQKHTLDGDVILLRKVDFRKMGSGIVEKIMNTNLRPGELEGDQVWFTDGYIAGEHPRDALVAASIMQNTLGFAIARTDSGEILKEFGKNEARRAEEVTHSATVELAIDVALSAADKAEESEVAEAN